MQSAWYMIRILLFLMNRQTVWYVVTARSVTDYLKRLKEEGKLVIISTHIMSEAEKLCDRIGVIIDGRKVMEGHLEDILRETQTEDLEDVVF